MIPLSESCARAVQTQAWLRHTQEKLEEATRAANEAEARAEAANQLAVRADELADAASQRRRLAEEAQHRAETLPDTIKVSCTGRGSFRV